jgi:hypothetical protein
MDYTLCHISQAREPVGLFKRGRAGALSVAIVPAPAVASYSTTTRHR